MPYSAPLSYFSRNDVGSILNRRGASYSILGLMLIASRFSQDIQLVDKQLPSALQTIVTRKSHAFLLYCVNMLTLPEIFKLLMQIILFCMAEKWLALSLPACALLVYVVQKTYLRTSRQLRFLELESRAEVFSNFLETVRIQILEGRYLTFTCLG